MTETEIGQLRHRLKDRLTLGFGVSGPLATRLFSSSDIDRLIGTARDQGISIFDTAPSYGAGLGERRIGDTIGNDASAFVMTKAGLTAKGWFDRRSSFVPQNIVQNVEASLGRLKRDRIDLLWLHGPGRDQIDERLKETLAALIQAGKVAAVGIASRNRPASALAGDAPFSAIMAPVSEARSTPQPDPSDPVFFGIECLKNVPSDGRIPRHRSHLWRATKALLRKQQPVADSVSAVTAFDFAFETARCDIAMTTTTRSSRIEQNRMICEAISDRREKAMNRPRVRPRQTPSEPHAADFRV